MAHRPVLAELGLNTGKKARLHRILHEHGLRNGTAFFLPYDQGPEHGLRDFFANPAASDPKYIIKPALEGGFNGIAIQIGLAEKFYWDSFRSLERREQSRHRPPVNQHQPTRLRAGRTTPTTD
jgi:class I fructose-bisphosphate aldolase